MLPSRPPMPVQRIHCGLLLAFRQVSIDFQRDLYIAVTEEFLCRLHIHPGIVLAIVCRSWWGENALRT